MSLPLSPPISTPGIPPASSIGGAKQSGNKHKPKKNKQVFVPKAKAPASGNLLAMPQGTGSVAPGGPGQGPKTGGGNPPRQRSANIALQSQFSDVLHQLNGERDTVRELKKEMADLKRNQTQTEQEDKKRKAREHAQLERENICLKEVVAKFSHLKIEHTPNKAVLKVWPITLVLLALCIGVASAILARFISWYFLMSLLISVVLILVAAWLLSRRTGRRYRYEFQDWYRPFQHLPHPDLRDDCHAQGEMKHEDALYATFKFTDTLLGVTRTLHVSFELLSQISTSDCISLRLNSEDAWKRIYMRASTLQSVNISRYLGAIGINVVQDTAILCHALYMREMELRAALPFPIPAL